MDGDPADRNLGDFSFVIFNNQMSGRSLFASVLTLPA